jgi:ABC-type amino acid transport substrate-binding protein
MKRAMTGLALALLLLTASPADAQVPRTLTFCASAKNAPLSEENPSSGFEVEFARALAAKLGAQSRFEWLDPHAASFEQSVLDGRCHAALGAIVDPVPAVGNRTLPGVTLTVPYYGAGYVLIRRVAAKPVRALAELGEARLAIEGDSVVAYTLRQRGHGVHLLKNAQAVVTAVAKGVEDYGYLWGPIAAWQLRGRNDVVVDAEFRPVDRWSFALAVRQSDGALRQALNEAITKLIEDGTAASAFAKHGGLYLKP